MVCLATADFLNAKTAITHSIVWSSTLNKRVSRSALMAETFAMLKGTEQGARIRAAIVDAKGLLDTKRWEETSSDNMSHVWAADCKSLYERLISPKI